MRSGVDSRDAQRFPVVHPHRVGVLLEEGPILLVALERMLRGARTLQRSSAANNHRKDSEQQGRLLQLEADLTSTADALHQTETDLQTLKTKQAGTGSRRHTSVPSAAYGSRRSLTLPSVEGR